MDKRNSNTWAILGSGSKWIKAPQTSSDHDLGWIQLPAVSVFTMVLAHIPICPSNKCHRLSQCFMFHSKERQESGCVRVAVAEVIWWITPTFSTEDAPQQVFTWASPGCPLPSVDNRHQNMPTQNTTYDIHKQKDTIIYLWELWSRCA